MKKLVILTILICAGCTIVTKKCPVGTSSASKLGTGIKVEEGASSSIEENGKSIMKALEEELNRSMKRLKMSDHSPPYFISYTVRDIEETNINARYGSIYYSETTRVRLQYPQIRVGTYKFDSSKSREIGVEFELIDQYDYYLPLNNDIDALRNRLWLVTDQKYKEALSSYFRKKAKNVYRPKKDEADDFSRESPHIFIGSEKTVSIDNELCMSLLAKVSAYFKKFPEILDSGVTLNIKKVSRYFINSEGSRVETSDMLIFLYLVVKAKAEDGSPLENYRFFSSPNPNDIADENMLNAAAKDIVEEILALRKAPLMDPYTGPAVLSPEVTGVFFHEVIGHRLEGERQKDEKEGMTFKDKVGQKIIPEFFTIIDDPTMSNYKGTSLAGNYSHDDEGVPAQRIVLIENGILKNFILSRTPIKGFSHSNGHGRNSATEEPMARMSNFFVTSSQDLSPDVLKAKLLEECKKRGKPFGFFIKSITSGETNTTKYGFQAFKGAPILVYKVYADDGREELLRGVEIVGTPLTSINNIIAAANDYKVFNGYCGAESGFIPVSTIAPSVLVSEIELQRTGKEKKKPPILPPPAFDE